jgi:hypothetical protein
MEISGGGVAIDNDTIKTNTNGKIYINRLPTTISKMLAEHELEILEIQANASITPLTHDLLISEVFSDADGYNNLVNTGNTDAVFNTNLYMSAILEDIGLSVTIGSGQNKQGVQITCTSDVDIMTVNKASGSGASKAYIHLASDGSLVSEASFVGDISTFTGLSLRNGISYYVVVDDDGSSFTARKDNTLSGTFPISGTKMTFDAGVYWDGSAWQISTTTIWDVVSITVSGSSTVEIDLPEISGQVIATQLIIEGDDTLTYDIVDTDSNSQSGLEINTYNELDTADGTKITGGKLKLNLSTTVNGVCLKLWVA